MLSGNKVLLIKIESSYGVDAAPVASTDAILAENISWAHDGLRMIDRPAIRASNGTLQQVYGGSLKSISFDVEIKGAGAAYSASVLPELDAPLRACGLSATLVTTASNESVTYTPASSGHESATVYLYEDGILHKLTGCYGEPSGTCGAGSIGKMSFTLTGHYSTVTDVSMPTASYDQTIPPAVVNSAFTIDGFAAVISEISFSMGNQIAKPPSVAASDGFGDLAIIKRDPSGSFNPEAELVATEDFIGNFESGANMALSFGAVGGVQYNRYTITMPAVYYRDVVPGDRDGIYAFDITYAASESTTDDEISIVFN